MREKKPVSEKVRRKIGRPRVIETPEEMDQLLEDYLTYCEEENEPLTLTGMILFFGLNSRQAFDEYGKRPGFFDSFRKCKMIIEQDYEKALRNNAVAGSIFALKANFHWKDQHQVELTGANGGPVVVAATNLDEKL